MKLSLHTCKNGYYQDLNCEGCPGVILVRMWNGIGWKMAWGFFTELHYLAILLCVPKKMVTLAGRLGYISSNGRAQCLVCLAFGRSWGSIPRTTWPLNTASCGPGGLSSPFGARELDCRTSARHLCTGGWVQSTAPCGPLSSPCAWSVAPEHCWLWTTGQNWTKFLASRVRETPMLLVLFTTI